MRMWCRHKPEKRGCDMCYSCLPKGPVLGSPPLWPGFPGPPLPVYKSDLSTVLLQLPGLSRARQSSAADRRWMGGCLLTMFPQLAANLALRWAWASQHHIYLCKILRTHSLCLRALLISYEHSCHDGGKVKFSFTLSFWHGTKEVWQGKK